jgi:hypothetical protein
MTGGIGAVGGGTGGIAAVGAFAAEPSDATVGASAGCVAPPHDAQKRAPGRSAAPHDLQYIDFPQ